MKSTLPQINLDKRQTLTALLDDKNSNRDLLRGFLQDLNKELAEAEQRLAEYQTQAQGKN